MGRSRCVWSRTWTRSASSSRPAVCPGSNGWKTSMPCAACHVSAVEKCGLLTRPVGLRGVGRRLGDVHAAEEDFAGRPMLPSGGGLCRSVRNRFGQVLGGIQTYPVLSSERADTWHTVSVRRRRGRNAGNRASAFRCLQDSAARVAQRCPSVFPSLAASMETKSSSDRGRSRASCSLTVLREDLPVRASPCLDPSLGTAASGSLPLGRPPRGSGA